VNNSDINERIEDNQFLPWPPHAEQPTHSTLYSCWPGEETGGISFGYRPISSPSFSKYPLPSRKVTTCFPHLAKTTEF